MSDFRPITAICSDLEQLLAAMLAESDVAFHLAEEVGGHPEGIQAVPQLLALLERNPAMDWGTPGPMVQAAEQFFGRGYEQLLLESVRRVPTTHTLWMLNRVVNGVPAGQRESYLSAMREASTCSDAPNGVRQVAVKFLCFQHEQA